MRKNKETIECDKSIVTCNVGTTQCENDIIKCEKKNKETIECNKSIVTCDVGTVHCKDDIIKYEKNKKRKLPNITKVQSHVMLVLHNIKMILSNIIF